MQYCAALSTGQEGNKHAIFLQDFFHKNLDRPASVVGISRVRSATTVACARHVTAAAWARHVATAAWERYVATAATLCNRAVDQSPREIKARQLCGLHKSAPLWSRGTFRLWARSPRFCQGRHRIHCCGRIQSRFCACALRHRRQNGGLGAAQEICAGTIHPPSATDSQYTGLCGQRQPGESLVAPARFLDEGRSDSPVASRLATTQECWSGFRPSVHGPGAAPLSGAFCKGTGRSNKTRHGRIHAEKSRPGDLRSTERQGNLADTWQQVGTSRQTPRDPEKLEAHSHRERPYSQRTIPHGMDQNSHRHPHSGRYFWRTPSRSTRSIGSRDRQPLEGAARNRRLEFRQEGGSAACARMGKRDSAIQGREDGLGEAGRQ